MRRADHRACDEGGERDRHARAAAAEAAQGARGAAAAELHADAEEEGAEGDRDADRRERPGKALAEGAALGKQRREDEAGERQHQELRAHAGTAALDQEAPCRRGEAEERVE